MGTTNANCYKPPFPACEKALSEIDSVTNPDGSITYTHNDGDGGTPVSWTTGGPSVADIYVNNGSFNAITSELTLNDTDAGTPNVVIDLSALEVNALNGTSLDTSGNVVLGNDVGATDAQLTSPRQIPQNGNDIIFTNNQGDIVLRGAGSIIDMNRDGANYIRAKQANGDLRFVTSGDTFISDMILNTDGRLGLNTQDFTSNTGKNVRSHFLSGDLVNGEDFIFDSGLDDHSGMVLTRLDTNTPATPGLATIGIDNNGLVGVVQGASGSFTAGGQTVTVTNGIITSII